LPWVGLAEGLPTYATETCACAYARLVLDQRGVMQEKAKGVARGKGVCL